MDWASHGQHPGLLRKVRVGVARAVPTGFKELCIYYIPQLPPVTRMHNYSTIIPQVSQLLITTITTIIAQTYYHNYYNDRTRPLIILLHVTIIIVLL